MSHSVSIAIKEPDGKRQRVIQAKEMTVRERVMSALFGKKAKVLILTPYESVNEITIKENGGNENDRKRSIEFGCN